MDGLYASAFAAPPEEIIAIRYVAVSVVKTADGAGVYSYVFHLRTASNAIYSLGARYSVLRRLSSLLLAESPNACEALPAFPPKHSMRRQTPDFLLMRGRALEAYLGAALGSPSLNTLPAVRELLRAAELHRPPGLATDSTPGTIPTQSPFINSSNLTEVSSPGDESSPAVGARADLRDFQRSSVKMRSIAARTNAAVNDGNGTYTAAAAAIESASVAKSDASGGGSVEVLIDLLLHPLVALALAGSLGYYFQRLMLCLSCCLLGLGAGRLCHLLSAPPKGANGSGANGSSNGRSLGPVPPYDSPQALPREGGGVADAARSSSNGDVGLRRRHGSNGAEETVTELDRMAGREALRGLTMLQEAANGYEVDGSGWKHFQRKENVDVWLNPRPDGSTWCMGIGMIRATPEAAYRSFETTSPNQDALDKQLISVDKIREVPHSVCRAEGWQVLTLELRQSLFRSPAFPIAPRECLAVRAVFRRDSDGAHVELQRSVEVPGVAPPKGYVRATCDIGGFEFVPTGKAACRTTYVNILNPNGAIPTYVVNKVVPERALVVSRLRNRIEKKDL